MVTEQDQKSLPRYMGIPTFMRTPYQPDPEGLDIALIGVPYDGGVTNRPGTRHGPREIRNQSSLMRSIHHVTFNLIAFAEVSQSERKLPTNYIGYS